MKISWLMCLTPKLFVRFEVVAERKAEDWRTDGSRNIFIRRNWILYYLVFKIPRFQNSICLQVNWNNRTLSFKWWKYFLLVTNSILTTCSNFYLTRIRIWRNLKISRAQRTETYLRRTYFKSKVELDLVFILKYRRYILKF